MEYYSDGFNVKARSKKEILSEILNFRNELYPKNPDYLPIDYLLDSLQDKEIVFKDKTRGKIRINWICDQVMKDTYAKTIPRNERGIIEILIKNSVYYQACENDKRARFTIAHEIAHVILHGNEKITFN